MPQRRLFFRKQWAAFESRKPTYSRKSHHISICHENAPPTHPGNFQSHEESRGKSCREAPAHGRSDGCMERRKSRRIHARASPQKIFAITKNPKLISARPLRQLALQWSPHPAFQRPLVRWRHKHRIRRERYPAAASHRHRLSKRWQLPRHLDHTRQEGTAN